MIKVKRKECKMPWEMHNDCQSGHTDYWLVNKTNFKETFHSHIWYEINFDIV